MFSCKAVIFIALCNTVNTISTTAVSNASWNVFPLCRDGWKLYEQDCFKLVKSRLTWEKAAVTCNGMGGYLASIHSAEQNDFFEEFAKEAGDMPWWIGLRRLRNDTIYSWDDGTDLDYTNWRPGAPSERFSKQEYGVAQSFNPGSVHGMWYAMECNHWEFPFVCQKETYSYPNTTVDTVAEKGLSSCEEGWKQYDQHCFKLEEEHLDWNKASYKCISMGGYLASIHSKEQNDFFEVFSKESEKSYWWIGLYNLEQDKFLWDDGTDVDYTNWKPRQPHSYFHESAYCVAKSFNINFVGNWYTLDCRRQLPYMCQRNVSITVIPNKEKTDNPVNTISTTTVPNSPGKGIPLCADGWKLHEQHCFKLEGKGLSWYKAAAKCNRMGGYMISIHCKEQNDFLEEFTKETGEMFWWIGLRRLRNDSRYLWDDGTAVNYTNWRPNQPRDSHIWEQCVAQSFVYSSRDGMWYPMDCHRLDFSFVCKRELGIFEATSTELDATTVARTVITSTEMDHRTVPTIIKNIENNEKDGFISVTTNAVTLAIVIVFMALLGALFCFKQPWMIEESHSKAVRVSFRKTERIAEPST